MIRKINIITFIFLTIFLISSVSAAETENETNTIEQTELNNINIESNDIDMFFNDGTRFKVEIQDETHSPIDNATLTININGVDYSRQSNSRGQASIPLKLNIGEYIVTTTFPGTENYNPLIKENTVDIKSTIYSDDVVKVFRNSTQYLAKFIDTSGNTLTKTAVTFNINGVYYTRTTNDNGIARLNLNLEQGTYIITALNPNTSEMRSNNITILPTITDNRDVVKYYKNSTQYVVTLIGKTGERVGSGEIVEFNINGIFYYRQTNINGQARLNLNLEPGTYIITAQYNGCRVSNKIRILPTLIANDIEMEYKDGTKFKAYLLDNVGNPARNSQVTFNINGIFYTRNTNANGIASLNINLEVGSYIITSENNGLRISNKILITPKTDREIVENTEFTHEIKIPNYVNVTYPYVFENSAYTLKSGIDGIIKLEKYQLIEIQIGSYYYTFSTGQMPEYGATYLGYEYYLLPFDTYQYQHSYKFENLKGNGIILYRSLNYTHIIYRNNCTSNVEQFGVYIDKSLDKSEIINYIQNGENPVRIQFRTMGFDELGLKYSLSKYHGGTIYDFNYKSYDTITNGNTNKIKFINTNESVTFNYGKTKIMGYISEEEIITKFNSLNSIEFEKSELITYGLSDKYKHDFDVLESFLILNKKVSKNVVNEWISKENEYKANAGMTSIYAMFITSLNTAYLSDKLADELTKDYAVSWKRSKPAVILSAMDWKETYQHVLTPDMGRSIEGNNESEIISFRFVNSLLLSKIEQYSLNPIAEDADDNVTSAFDDVFKALSSYKVSVVYYNETAFIIDGERNSTFIIDLKSGLVTPLSVHDDFAYKGATVTRDCGLCSTNSMLKEVMKQVNNIVMDVDSTLSIISDNIQPITSLAIKGTLLAKGFIGGIFGGTLGVGLTIFGTAISLQSIGVYVVDNILDEKDIHTAYDYITFTRPGYLQNAKIYNIPQENGSTDYIEIPIKSDNSLDRDNVQYISNGNVRKLTRQETYNYFTEETWEPFNVPRKYWS